MIIEILDNELYGEKLVRGSANSAGLDLKSTIDVDIIAGGIYKIPLGVKTACDTGRFIAMHMRSGMAKDYGLFLINGVGVIDADYRGELCAIVSSLSNVSLSRGNRIVQIVEQLCWTTVMYSKVDDTERGVGGFGSTGRE